VDSLPRVEIVLTEGSDFSVRDLLKKHFGEASIPQDLSAVIDKPRGR
jgi:hypothetical protein